MSKAKNLLDAVLDGVTLRRWRSRAKSAGTEGMGRLRQTAISARTLRAQLDAYLRTTEDRLTIPKVGSDVFRDARGNDWSWRADAWRWRADNVGFAAAQNGTEIAPSLKIFHDCHNSEISTRQLRNQRDDDLAPFGVRLDVFGFDGSFLSIVLDLPKNAAQSLRKNHLVRLNTIIEAEKPIEIFARLNIQHGPNTEQLVRGLRSDVVEGFVEFDLETARLNENRIDHIWLDLIFDNPAMNQITLRELSMSLSPRSEF